MIRSLKIVPLFVVASVSRKGGTAGMYPVWKRWRTKASTLIFLLCMLVPALHAQEGASGDRQERANPDASGERVKPDCVEKADERSEKPLCISEKVKSLRLGLEGRFARGFQYEYKLNEQPGTVLVNSGTGAGAITAFLRNPQNYLQQHTLTFKFGELFPDRMSLFKRGSDYLKKYPLAADKQPSEILCGDNPLITCLAEGGSWWQRALMATSVIVNFSQRALVQQGIIATPTRFGKDYQVNGGFVFDPAKLFPTATSWKGAFDEVQKVDKALALLGASDVRLGRRPWEQSLLAAIVPKVEYKVISQFDYLKYNGALIEAPFPERALNTFTFTWDLTRAIPDTKSRIDADAIYASLNELKNGFGPEEETAWQKRCTLSFDKGAKDREVKDLHPAFEAESCQQLAQVMNAKQYRLSCFKEGKNGKADEREDGDLVDTRARPDAPSPNSCKWIVK